MNGRAVLSFALIFAWPCLWAAEGENAVPAAPGAPDRVAEQQNSTSEKATLAIAKIAVAKSLSAKAAKDGASEMLGRITEALEGNLVSAFHAGRRFELLVRSDLDAVMAEISLSDSGNVAADRNAAAAGKLKGAKYLLVVSVDDFQQIGLKKAFASLDKTVWRKSVRVGVSAKMIDSSTGAVVDAGNFSSADSGVAEMWSQIKSEADFNDFLAAKISRELADKIASKMTDAAFPVRVVAKTGKYVTINRGEGAGVSVGDEYTVFAAGRKMKDPDTGEFLGTEEIPIGKIRIEAVSAKTSRGVAGEDMGVEIGQIARKTNRGSGQ